MLQKRIKTSLATLNLYLGNIENDDILTDMSALISILNDNDNVLDRDGTIKVIDNEYGKIKNKKKLALKNYLNKNSNSSPTDKN